MKKKIFLIIVMFFIAGVSNAAVYDMNVPLEGASIANDSLQTDVLKKLYPIIFKLNTLCYEMKVTDTQIIHYPYDVVKKNGKYRAGYWQELWTVNYCGQKVQVPVLFKINKHSTTFSIDKNLILN